MNLDPFDKLRDYELDFPDDPRAEPDLAEVKERMTLAALGDYYGVEDE